MSSAHYLEGAPNLLHRQQMKITRATPLQMLPLNQTGTDRNQALLAY